jgi:hypothetical protein
MEKIGFVNEGLKRKVHYDGKAFIDIYVYGLLKKDFFLLFNQIVNIILMLVFKQSVIIFSGLS